MKITERELREWKEKTMLRATGRTTRQMRAAPRDAVFISCTQHSVSYDRHLARALDRDDLKIVAPHWLTNYGWAGMLFTAIVVDHDAHLTTAEQHCLEKAVTRCRTTGVMK